MTFLGIVLTGLTVWIAYLALTKGRELSCQVDVACFSSLVPHESLDENLQPSYKGLISGDLCFSTVHFVSTGEPIVREDFQRSIEIWIGQGASIVEAEMRTRIPEELETNISYDSVVVRIEPALINTGDEFMIYIVSQGASPDIQVKSRIKGISAIETKTSVRSLPDNRVLGICLGIASGLSWFLGFGVLGKVEYSQSNSGTHVVILPKRSIGRWLIPLCAMLSALCAIFATSYAEQKIVIFPLIGLIIGMYVSTFFIFRNSFFSVFESVHGKRRNDVGGFRLGWDDTEESKGYLPPPPEREVTSRRH